MHDIMTGASVIKEGSVPNAFVTLCKAYLIKVHLHDTNIIVSQPQLLRSHHTISYLSIIPEL
jgi:hypothetical protein